MRRSIILVSVLLLWLFVGPPARAQAGITATDDRASLQFPDTITFSVDLKAASDITQVELEYSVKQLTCGAVIAKAFPTFTPDKELSVEWAWEMKQSGSLPPGAVVHWRWHVVDSDGNELTTEEQTITWLDSEHDWQVTEGDNINLHWYEGRESFAAELHQAGVDALTTLDETFGLRVESPIDLYIYASTDDMREAILYEPGWTGGQAFPAHDIVIIGIAPDDIDWGKETVAHELTHVLVGHITFTCLGYIPNWVQEGIAMYGEGGLDFNSQEAFDQAVADDTIISVRSLSGGFSEASDKANISYSESYSLVNFLIEHYGKDDFLALLDALREGATVDGALSAIYGFDIDGLEDTWRAGIGAAARASTEPATPTPQPTVVPTYVPVSGAQSAPTAAPTRQRVTPSIAPTGTPEPPTETPIPTETSAAFRDTSIPPSTRTPTGTPAPTEGAPFNLPPEITNLFDKAWGCGAICLVGLAVIAFFYNSVIRSMRRRRKS